MLWDKNEIIQHQFHAFLIQHKNKHKCIKLKSNATVNGNVIQHYSCLLWELKGRVYWLDWTNVIRRIGCEGGCLERRDEVAHKWRRLKTIFLLTSLQWKVPLSHRIAMPCSIRVSSSFITDNPTNNVTVAHIITIPLMKIGGLSNKINITYMLNVLYRIFFLLFHFHFCLL